MADLTVCSVSNDDWKYLAFQDHVMRLLAHEKEFRRLVIDVSTTDESAERERRLPHTTVVRVDLKGKVGSEAHGAALNHILSHVDTEWMAIADPDTSVLAPAWDRTCRNELADACIAIGTPYDHRGVVCRYQNFPNAVLLFLRTDPLRRMRVNWHPDPQWLRKSKRWICRQLGKPLDDDHDVGWRLPKAFAKHGYRAKTFTFLKCTDPESVVLAPDARGDEFHWNGKPIFTHQGRSWTREFDVDPISRAWLDKVCAYLRLDREITRKVIER